MTLFAALDVPTGKAYLQVHLILDKHQTHEQGHPARQLPRRPRPVASLEHYLRVINDDPDALVWTASGESIVEKVRRGRVALQNVVNQSAKTETRHEV
jgi:hypothetical protein